MKKIEQKISQKRTSWLCKRARRAQKRLILQQMLRRQYARMRSHGRPAPLARQAMVQRMSPEQLDLMGDALERMFAPRSYVYRI